MIKRFLFLIMLTLITSLMASAQLSVKRVILFTIDGLHWQAPEKLKMPAFNGLIREGTFVRRSYVIIPHHPTVGDYSKFNSCSFPNPMLHTGTIFLRPEARMIQEVFSPKKQTAFIVNAIDYHTIGRGFSTTIMDPTLSDEQVMEQSIDLLKIQDPVFVRIHLQTPGLLGRVAIYRADPDKPYYRDIFGKGSPYAKSIEDADQLLGQLIAFLKKTGKWEETVLIVTSDHGQSKIGWHPLFDEDSWVTPFVIAGHGIARGRELPYLEHTDIAPTITWLLGVEPPNRDGGAGKAVKEVMQQYDASNYHPAMFIKKIDEQIKAFNILKSHMMLEAEEKIYLSNEIASLENELLTPEPFYHQDRIMDWYKAGSATHLVEANERILNEMRKKLDDN